MTKFKGEIEDFPEEIVEKMLYYQEQQGNKRDVSVFEERKARGKYNGGFDWNETPDGHLFWETVIKHRNFDLFFEKCPKNKYPKVMYVSDTPFNQINHPITDEDKRVVFMEKNGKYLAWTGVRTIKEAEDAFRTTPWNYAKDIEEDPSIEISVKINGKEAKLSDISDETLKRIKELEKC